MLWSKEQCRLYRRLMIPSEPLRFLWGGHNRASDFSRSGVARGDAVFPIAVSGGRIFLIGRLAVRELVTAAEYIRGHAQDAAFIQHACARQVLVGEFGSVPHFGLGVPARVLERWSFLSRRGSRGHKHLVGGRLRHSIVVHGVYRVSAETASDLFALLLEREVGLLLPPRHDGEDH
jgi:hypothetical protein